MRVSGVPPESSARMPKRSNSALTRRARSRSVVTSAAVALGSTMAPRSAVAIASASSCSFAASMSVTPANAASNAPSARRAPRDAPVVGRLGRPQRFAPGSPGAPPGRCRRRRSRRRRARLSPILREQLRQAELRMAEHRRLRPGRFDRPTTTARRAQNRDRAAPPRHWAGGRSPTSSSAVAGIEPVEPAAITGPIAGARASLAASMRISALRCAAGLERSRSRSASGQCDVTISRKSSVTCHQPARLPDARSPSFFQSAPSVSISSISAARSRASQMASAADAGTVTSSSNSAATCAGRRLFQRVHQRRQRQQPLQRRDRRRQLDLAGIGLRRPASSSSNSPSGRIAGRMVERAAKLFGEHAAKLARGTPRRHEDGGVGQRQRRAIPGEFRNQRSPRARHRPTSAGRARPPGSTGRAESARRSRSLPCSRGDGLFGERDGVGRADRDPVAIHLHAVEPPGGDGAVEIEVERLRARPPLRRRCAAQRSPRRHRSDPSGASAARASRPSASMRKSVPLEWPVAWAGSASMIRISIRAASQASASRSRLEPATVDPERIGVEDVERDRRQAPAAP